MVDPRTTANLVKTPSATSGDFRSVLLEIADPILAAFRGLHPAKRSAPRNNAPFREVALGDDLAQTLRHVCEHVADETVSDARMQHRIFELLVTLEEAGHTFASSGPPRVTDQLRELITAAPDRRWTAREAGHHLAMSESTLRRRLAREEIRFEELLIDARMHHGLMLLQTTNWTVPQVATACGYLSRARFTERFHARFGYAPSAAR